MYKLFKILFSFSKKSFIFISFIIFTSLFSFIFTWNIISSIESYIKDNSKDFLWADLVISDKVNFFDETKKYIEDTYIWETSKKISFETSIFYQNNPDLYTINYIERNYPFYWDFNQTEINPLWEIVVGKKVYDKFWNWDIEILWKKYKIKSYLEQDFLADFNPFWGNDIYIYYNDSDLSLNQEISRVRYELLVKSDQVDEIKKDKILEKYRINTEETSNNTLNEIIDRLNIFIQIFYQIIILLAFFIVTISMNSYFKKITKDLKVLNILWLSSYKIILSLFILFLIISIISASLSYLSVYLIFALLSDKISILFMDINLLYQSVFLSFLIILSWSFLNLINLKATWINNFWKENIYLNYKKYIISYFIFLLLIIFFISYFSWVSILYSLLISIWFLSFLLLVIFILNKVLKLLFNLIKWKISKNFYLFDSLRSTIKPWNLSIIIIISTFVSISWFLIFSTFSSWFIDFLNKNIKWQIDTFVINLNQEDIDLIKEDFDESEYYEIIRSRLLSINWKSLKDHLWVDSVSGRYTREFNTTTRPLLELIDEWKQVESGEVWVDREFAEWLWIKMWDKIKFLVLWLEKELTVTQIRKAERNWVSPFFYFNFYEKDFDWFSKNYFLSYNSKEKGENFNLELSNKIWEESTFINIWDIIDKIKDISLYILYFVYIILSYIAVFSIITFSVSIKFLKTFKETKIEIYNKFWWNKNKLKRGVFYEYSYLIIIWLIISIIFSLIIVFILFNSNQFLEFNLTYFINSMLYILAFISFYLLSYFVFNK